MIAREWLALAPGSSLKVDGHAHLICGHERVDLGDLPTSYVEAITALGRRPLTRADVDALARPPDAAGELRWEATLAYLWSRGALALHWGDAEAPEISYLPLTARHLPAAGSPPAAASLSRFAYLRPRARGMSLQTPLGSSRVLLHSRAAMGFLLTLCGDDSSPAAGEFLDAAARARIREVLWSGGYLADRAAPEAELRTWEFHDLLAHTRGRAGRDAAAYGGVFPFLTDLPAEPAAREPWPGEAIRLRRPDMERLRREDMSLTQAIETRRSNRQPGPEPLHLDQLAEVLYRAARIDRTETRETHEVSWGVYPAGGALHELEVYAFVGRCEGLTPGPYHYDAHAHRLTPIDVDSDAARRLLENAGATAGSEAPDVLLVFAARFERVMWKYRGMSYAGILKDVGVLMQNLYLVATATGLSACALGGGDSDLFAAATGLDYYREGAVGEMILNGPAAD